MPGSVRRLVRSVVDCTPSLSTRSLLVLPTTVAPVRKALSPPGLSTQTAMGASSRVTQLLLLLWLPPCSSLCRVTHFSPHSSTCPTFLPCPQYALTEALQLWLTGLNHLAPAMTSTGLPLAAAHGALRPAARAQTFCWSQFRFHTRLTQRSHFETCNLFRM